MSYNPFDIPINQLHKLTENDLQKLVIDKVSEGYWVEYKSMFPQNPKVAKSVASFANTYGGWYFVGIEADKINNAAQNISGFSLTDIPNPIDKLREIIKSYIDPTPVFYATLVQLNSGAVVLVSYIPDNQETPFVHQDGRIYRRVADSSDPIPEINRYAVDRLYDNGRKIHEEFRQFCQDERAFSEAEDNVRWANVYITPYPLDKLHRGRHTIAERIRSFKELSQKPLPIGFGDGKEYATGNMPFVSAQPTSNSIILRQVYAEQPSINFVEAELFIDGRAKFLVPLEDVPAWNEANIRALKSNHVRSALIRQMRENDELNFLRFFSIERLWLAITVLLNYYSHWYREEYADTASSTTQYKVEIHLENVWRSIAFLDSDEYGKHIQQYGLPIINRDRIQWPRSGRNHAIYDSKEDDLWLIAASTICMEVGLPEELIGHVAARSLSSFGTSKVDK